MNYLLTVWRLGVVRTPAGESVGGGKTKFIDWRSLASLEIHEYMDSESSDNTYFTPAVSGVGTLEFLTNDDDRAFLHTLERHIASKVPGWSGNVGVVTDLLSRYNYEDADFGTLSEDDVLVNQSGGDPVRLRHSPQCEGLFFCHYESAEVDVAEPMPTTPGSTLAAPAEFAAEQAGVIVFRLEGDGDEASDDDEDAEPSVCDFVDAEFITHAAPPNDPSLSRLVVLSIVESRDSVLTNRVYLVDALFDDGNNVSFVQGYGGGGGFAEETFVGERRFEDGDGDSEEDEQAKKRFDAIFETLTERDGACAIDDETDTYRHQSLDGFTRFGDDDLWIRCNVAARETVDPDVVADDRIRLQRMLKQSGILYSLG